MKLRQAKKILRNWQKDVCTYSNTTLTKASIKYKPYLVEYCKKKNKELKERGETSLFYAPYFLKNVTKLVGEPHQINIEKYKNTKVNTRYYCSFNGLKQI